VRVGEAANPGPPAAGRRSALDELRLTHGVVVEEVRPAYVGFPFLFCVEMAGGKRRLYAGSDITAGQVITVMLDGR
jgi:hypothetical protein